MDPSTQTNHTQSQLGPEDFPPNTDNLVMGADYTPMGVPGVFTEHHDQRIYSNNMAFTPKQYPPAHEREPFNVVQPTYMENDFCSFMGGNPHISRPWHSSQNLPLIPQLGSSDLIPKPLTTDLLDPYVSGTGAIPIAPRTDLVESVPLPNPTEYHSSPLLVASVHAEPRVPPALPSHASFQESRPNILQNDHTPYPVFLNAPSFPQFPIPSSAHENPNIPPGEPAPLHFVSPSTQVGYSNHATEANSVKDAQKAFARLVPLLKDVHAGNFAGFLLGVLQECHDHMPLDEFYCMLYSDYLKDRRTPNGAGPNNTEHLSRERLKATKLYSLILESFKKPETFQNGLLRNSLLYNVNFHEVQRNFLAMKILFGCIKQVDESSKILPRVSIYKLYYILCQRLLNNHPLSTSFSFDARENLVLGQSKIGILTKMIHPGLVYKRLGKRGMSITHYIGVTWNESMIDDEITGLLNLDIPKLREHFKTPAQDAHEPAVRSGSANPEATNKPDRISSPTKRTSLLSSKKPLYSFVDLSCKYPGEDCSPRLWRVTPSSVPKQSGWAKELTQKSVRVLKEHGVDLNPVVAKVNAGNYSDDDHSSIRDTLLQSINVLLRGSSCAELYLHLYLVVLLLLLPLIVASDEEFASVSKAQLRTSVKEFTVKLENEVAPNSSIDKTSLTIFTRVLRKMIHISELTSSSVTSSPTESVLKEMDHDIKSLTTTSDDTGDISPFQEIFIKGCMSALNAYKYNVSDLRDGNGQEGNLRTLINIGKSFQDVSLFITHTLQEIPLGLQECDDSNDLPFQVFHLSAKFFHEVTLALPEFSQLPIPIITFIILYYTNEMQQVSFAKFARRGPDLSKETFKCWWVVSSMLQEYMCVISEVVALSQALA